MKLVLDKNLNCINEAMAKRTEYTMELLVTYTSGLKPVHQAMSEKGKPFFYGM